MTRLRLVLSAVLLALAVPPFATAQTWTGAAGNFDWNTAANWSPATVPNSATAAVTFANAGVGTVKISSFVFAQSANYTNTSGNYTLTMSAGQTLRDMQTITVAPRVTGVETIDFPAVNTGSLQFPSGDLAINNNSIAGGSLQIYPNTVVGTGGNGGVIFAGPGATTYYGSFAAGFYAVSGGLTKTGPGSLNFGGDGSNLSGGLTLNGGTMQLDYSSNAASKLGLGALTLKGGSLTLIANQSTSVNQTFPGGTFVGTGHTDVGAVGIGNITMAAGTISRNVGGTIDFPPTFGGGPALIITTTTVDVNYLLGYNRSTGAVYPAFATFGGGATWAIPSGSYDTRMIAGLDTSLYSANNYVANVNTDVTTSALQAGITTSSLRFNNGAPTLTLSGTNTVQSGGILVTPSATGGTITGGTLKADVSFSGELLVHQYSGGTFTINSALISSVGLTKTGPGTLALGGNNIGLTGPININRGFLDVTNPAAVNSASALNFNDDRPAPAFTLGALQGVTFDFGNNVSGTLTQPILVSAYNVVPYYGTSFGIGFEQNSIITLSGVISSAPGQTTPIRFYGNNFTTSGFYLTNANTFTGNVSLYNGGILGITSDASLGNPANVLALESATFGGGLVFLNGGVTVARPIVVNLPTPIVSNGTDSNTISGPISGTGGIYKDGTGTLTITNPNNTVTGVVSVAAGTLSLGATGGLPAGTNVTVGPGATFTPGTSPNGNTLGTLALYGGTFRVSAGGVTPLYVNQIVTGPTGGTLDFTGVSLYAVELLGPAAPAITINGNSTWISPNNYTFIYNVSNADNPITIAAGVTLTNGIALSDNYGYGFHITGGGTLYQNASAGAAAYMSAPLTVSQSVFRVTDVSSNGGLGNLGTGTFTVDNGTFSYGGSTATLNKPVFLTAYGGLIQVEAATATLTINDPVAGPGGLTKTGPGTLLLTSLSDSFTSLTINAGTVQTSSDAMLGAGPVTINAFGTLTYTGTTTIARGFAINNGTMSVAAGQTATLNGATVAGGFLRGPGTFAVTGGTALGGVTTANSAVVSQVGPATFVNFTNGGTLTLAAGLATPGSFTVFTNQGSGTITVGAGSQLNVSDFQTYGTLTLNPATITETYANTTLLTNTGTSPMYLNGGSRTFVGTPATAVFPNNWPDATLRGLPTFVAGIDLNGKNTTVAGGLFVNNGYVEDTTNNGQGTATVIADFGSLVKGAGYFQNSVQTINGGKFQAGNSPGKATFGNFVLGPGGVSNYVFAIDDATGAAGPSPDANGHVSGWGLVKAMEWSVVSGQWSGKTGAGDFTWTATPADKLHVSLETLLNPTTVGTDVPGPMDHFDPTRSFVWPAVDWTGSYAGPTDAAMLDAATAFDLTGFANPIGGRFGWSFDAADRTLAIIYTPTAVPEPGALALTAVAALGWAIRRKSGGRDRH